MVRVLGSQRQHPGEGQALAWGKRDDGGEGRVRQRLVDSRWAEGKPPIVGGMAVGIMGLRHGAGQAAASSSSEMHHASSHKEVVQAVEGRGATAEAVGA